MEPKELNKINIKQILKIILLTLGILVVLIMAVAYSTVTTTIQVFLNKELSTEQEESIRKQLEAICNTTNIEYVSEDEALQQMKDFLKEDVHLLDYYNEDNNIFPSSYIIKDIKFNKFSKIKREVSKIDGITKIIADSFYIRVVKILLSIK